MRNTAAAPGGRDGDASLKLHSSTFTRAKLFTADLFLSRGWRWSEREPIRFVPGKRCGVEPAFFTFHENGLEYCAVLVNNFRNLSFTFHYLWPFLLVWVKTQNHSNSTARNRITIALRDGPGKNRWNLTYISTRAKKLVSKCFQCHDLHLRLNWPLNYGDLHAFICINFSRFIFISSSVKGDLVAIVSLTSQF